MQSIFGGERIYSDLDKQCTSVEGQQAGINTHVGFVRFFKKLFGLACDVTIGGKLLCVNKESFRKFLIRSHVYLPDTIYGFSAQKLKEEMETKLQALYTFPQLEKTVQDLDQSIQELQSDSSLLQKTAALKQQIVVYLPQRLKTIQYRMQTNPVHFCLTGKSLLQSIKKDVEGTKESLIREAQEEKERLIREAQAQLEKERLIREAQLEQERLIRKAQEEKERMLAYARELQFKLPLVQGREFQATDIRDRDDFFRILAFRNNYGEKLPAPTDRPELAQFLRLYEEKARPLRDLWRSQCPQMAKIEKVTKRGFRQQNFFIKGQELGSGTSKIAHKITILKSGKNLEELTTTVIQKIKVLASRNVATITYTAQGFEEGILSEYNISQDLRNHGVPSILFIHKVNVLSSNGTVLEVGAFSELCEGGTLEDYLKKAPPPSEREKMTLALELARSLARFHDAGYVHSDLKLANIFIKIDRDANGNKIPHIRLADFGFTKHENTPDVPWLSTFVSPEQAFSWIQRGDQYRPVSRQTDLWALGELLCSLLFNFNQSVLIQRALTYGGLEQKRSQQMSWNTGIRQSYEECFNIFRSLALNPLEPSTTVILRNTIRDLFSLPDFTTGELRGPRPPAGQVAAVIEECMRTKGYPIPPP